MDLRNRNRSQASLHEYKEEESAEDGKGWGSRRVGVQ